MPNDSGLPTPKVLSSSGGMNYIEAARRRLESAAKESSASLWSMLSTAKAPVVSSGSPSQAASPVGKKGSTTTPATGYTYKGKGSLSDRQLEDILKQAGFKGKALQVAFGIAKRESSGNPRAHNDNTSTGDDSYGLFQINLLGSLRSRVKQYGLSSPQDFLDPLTNAKVAYKMSNGGKNFGPWAWGPNAYRNSAELNQRVIDNVRKYYGNASLL